MYASQILKELSHSLHISKLVFDNNWLCRLNDSKSGLNITFESNEDEDVLFACAKLGVMPDDDNGAAAIALLFAQANMDLSVKDKGVLIVDYDSEGLLLVKFYELHYWNVSECVASIMQYLDSAIEWYSRLAMPDFGIENFVSNISTVEFHKNINLI